MSYGYWDVLKSVGLFAAIRNMLAKRCCPRQGLGWLRSKYLQHPICFRNGSTDLGVFAQIFICLEYACFNQLSDVGLILDLGANVGYSAAYFLSTFKSCFVVCVEPDPDNFNVLLENLKPYEGRYLAIKAAVWPEPTDLWFVPATLGVNNEWGRQVTSSPSAGQPMQTVTIPQIMEMTGRDRISILKVDIEGGVRSVLAKLGRLDLGNRQLVRRASYGNMPTCVRQSHR